MELTLKLPERVTTLAIPTRVAIEFECNLINTGTQCPEGEHCPR